MLLFVGYILDKWYGTVNYTSNHHGDPKQDALLRYIIKNRTSGNYSK